MKRTNIAIGGLSLVIVAGVAYWEFGRLTSPGGLHPTHARIVELKGSKGCAVCHGDETRSMADACIECHGEIRGQIDHGSGFHGAMDSRVAPDSCQVCHLEHSGGVIELVSLETFRAAGVADRGSYDHAELPGFGLEGRHDSLSCRSCHAHAESLILLEGQSRYLGLSQACESCHEDSHGGAYGQDCASCHGQSEAFDTAAAFAHTDSFPLIDSHAGLSCKACHEDGTASAISHLMDAPPSGSVRGCVDCHGSPHDEAFLVGIGAPERLDARATCAVCHRVEHADFLFPDATMTREQHGATGFVLDPPHDTQQCEDCHESIGARSRIADASVVRSSFEAFFPGRSADACRSCHEDPHAGQFDTADRIASCLDCHDPLHFEPSRFDAAMHARTGFALVDGHAGVACADCHHEVAGVVRFAGTAADCASCHSDPHGGQFVSADGGLRLCTDCHGTKRFDATRFTLDDHQRTAFPLTGSHQAVACRSCHGADEAGVHRFVGVSHECASCHEDVHKGSFDRPGLPVVVNGVRGCARCHGTGSFSDVLWAGDMHERWTGYALVGAHAGASCVDCHGAARGVNAVDRFARTSGDCVSCHEDVHAGQFAVGIVNDCARCHTERRGFEQTTFDHQRDSRFALDEQHIGLDCAACHRPVRTGDGRAVTRYRPMGMACGDCHGFVGNER